MALDTMATGEQTMRDVRIQWARLVRHVRAGRLETYRSRFKPGFMFWPERGKSAFLSDRVLLGQIDRARAHNGAFMLFGPLHSGKYAALNLIAKGSGNDQKFSCVAENIVDGADEELERFFGREGVVDRNRDALIHFDYMDRAAGWETFNDKIHKLAIDKVLERTDGKRFAWPYIRVALGATMDLTGLPNISDSLTSYLYEKLSASQRIRTRSLNEQLNCAGPEPGIVRLAEIFAEMIATLVLDSRATLTQARAIELVPADFLRKLCTHSPEMNFTQMSGITREAIYFGSWSRALPEPSSDPNNSISRFDQSASKRTIESIQVAGLPMISNQSAPEYDLFLSHASEDKAAIHDEEIERIQQDPQSIDFSKLTAELEGLAPGNDTANRYHDFIIGALEAIFSSQLRKPAKEEKIFDGRKRIDIVFNNRADVGFFRDLHVLHRVHCPYVFFECKNYSVDLKNPEFDQLTGRFSDKRGMFGILVCRANEDLDNIIKRCKDVVNSNRGYVLVLDDADIKAMLRLRSNQNYDAINNYMAEKFRPLVF
jgi:hypothetical protein